jgi:putative hydrolase of the HAD superfamily
MKKYPVVFFDLDHTLWDFDRNSEEALCELYELHHLSDRGIPNAGKFIEIYRAINHQLWSEYHHGRLLKEELRILRFSQTFENFGFRDPHLEKQFADQYLSISPYKKNLLPGAEKVLQHLSVNRSLHIITNGFCEVQRIKMKHSGLDKYFNHIHISEEVGYMKPDPMIFHHAIRISGSDPASCIMIGDNYEADIMGANSAGIDAIFFNPQGRRVKGFEGSEIRELEELIHLLGH